MSSHCRIIWWGCSFVKTPLQNGIGRYIPQLQRITFKFCKSSGGSLGTREYIEKNLLTFANENPSVVVYVKPRRRRSSCLKAEYLNGNHEYISTHNFLREDIVKWVEYLRTKSGDTTTKFLLKRHHTDYPSIQGAWTPFVNKEPWINVANFPNDKLSAYRDVQPSGTEELLELFQRQKIEEPLEEQKS